MKDAATASESRIQTARTRVRGDAAHAALTANAVASIIGAR